MPPIVGTKNQPKSPSPSARPSMCRCSSTNAGAEEMYRNNAEKLNAPAAARRWNRGLRKIAA